MREKLSEQPPPTPIASTIGPCPTIIQISRTSRHWKFTQHIRTTRPPRPFKEGPLKLYHGLSACTKEIEGDNARA